MLTAGIDMGGKTTKLVFMKDHEIVFRKITPTGFDQRATAEQIFLDSLKECNLSKNDVQQIVATGAGRKDVPFAHTEVTEVTADAKGAVFLIPSVRTLIDVGAEEGRAMRVAPDGKVMDFVVNEKCAAGAGAFTEAMARALEIDIDDFGKYAMRATNQIPMNAQCTIFAESEVVSLIHAKTPREDIARAVIDAIASRISATVRRIGIEKDLCLIGGVAKNIGFVEALKRDLGVEIKVPQEPEYVGALGAALIAAAISGGV